MSKMRMHWSRLRWRIECAVWRRRLRSVPPCPHHGTEDCTYRRRVWRGEQEPVAESSELLVFSYDPSAREGEAP